jgi:flagellar export protein FliJ
MDSPSSPRASRGQSQLLRVRSLALSREQQLAGEVAGLMRQQVSAAATVEQLRGYLHEYQREQTERGPRLLITIENERRFAKRLNTALDQQSTYVQRLEDSTSAKKRLWERERANVQALDRLLLKREHAQLRQQERREQKETDAQSLRAINNGAFR